MRRVRSQRPLLAGEVLVVLALVFVYDRIREFAAARADLAIANGRGVLAVETRLHVNLEAVMNHTLSRHTDWALASSWYYQLMHLVATLTVLLWIYWRRPAAYRCARNALVGINTAALLVFWAFPVAPPRLIPGAGYIDSTVVSHVADKATTVSPDLYAAMPSLHVAWASWVVLEVALATSNRPARVLAATHAAITVLAVLATANHYVMDVLAGGVLATIIVWSSRLRLPSAPDGIAQDAKSGMFARAESLRPFGSSQSS